MSFRTIMLAAAAVAVALPAAAQRIPVAHLADYSGPTSDVGKPYGEGVADALNWVNSTRSGVAGRQLGVSFFDYGYQAPRAIAQYQAWTSRERVVAIQGWGTVDTEALIQFVARDRIPYISGSYSAALTDPNGRVQLLLRPQLQRCGARAGAVGGRRLEGAWRPGPAQVCAHGRQPPLPEQPEGSR
jgi:branched-chain amino acid transport system substrate-binding protein